MKIIIEEGDVGGLPPGVYKTSCAGSYVECLQDEAINLNLNLDVDMAQKPKPVPPGGRYSFEFKRFERLGPDDTVFEVSAHDRVDPSKSYYHRLAINNLMLDAARRPNEIMEDFARKLTWHVVNHVVENILQAMRTASKTEPCNKTLVDCRRHGNMDRFGAIGAGLCPFTFGDSRCGAHPQPPPLPAGCQPVQTDPPVYNDTPYYTYADEQVADNCRQIEEAMASLDQSSEGGFISNVVFPKTKPKDCDECYGTGRFKGIGGPCSEGCPTKEGS